MSQLDNLSQEEAALIVSLPYRVGIWISHADDESGELDDRREGQALEAIIKSIARLHEKSAFVQETVQETLRLRDNWPAWLEDSFNILPDCEKAMASLKAHLSDSDLKNYKTTLLQIAETVARAHGEFGMGAEKEEGALAGFLGKMAAKLKGESDEADFANISPTEEGALSRLKEVLCRDDDKSEIS